MPMFHSDLSSFYNLLSNTFIAFLLNHRLHKQQSIPSAKMSTASGASASGGASAPTASEQYPFSCNGCSIHFENMRSQRLHTKEPWHVYNVKRRMAALPPITLDVFQTQIETGASTVEDENDGSPQSSSDESDTSNDINETAEPLSPSHCLLCGIDSLTLEQNVSHMQHSHGLHIPEKRYLTDLESFIGYLGVLVLQYHECLYCGGIKRSVQGIRQHMLAKGHCMINLSPESELLDFYEFDRSSDEEDDDGYSRKTVTKKPIKLSATELQLPSGAIVPARSNNHIVSGKRHHSSGKRPRQKAVLKIAEGDSQEQHEQPRRSRDQRVAVRGEMGMLGVPEQQKRALRAVEKKLLKQEMVAKAHQRWAVEKVANRQKNFKPDVPGPKNG